MQNSSQKNLAAAYQHSAERDIGNIPTANRVAVGFQSKMNGLNLINNSHMPEPSSPQIAFQNHVANYQKNHQAGKQMQ